MPNIQNRQTRIQHYKNNISETIRICQCQFDIQKLKKQIIENSLQNQIIKKQNLDLIKIIQMHSDQISDPWKQFYENQKKINQEKVRYLQSLKRTKQFSTVKQILRSHDKNNILTKVQKENFKRGKQKIRKNQQQTRRFLSKKWDLKELGTQTMPYKQTLQNESMRKEIQLKYLNKTTKKTPFLKTEKLRLKIGTSQSQRKNIH